VGRLQAQLGHPAHPMCSHHLESTISFGTSF
jgi:hypothetical protein